MDEDQVRVAELLANIAAKLFLALIAGMVFVAVTIKLILDPSWPMVVAEGLLSGTVYVVFRHYFPAKG